MRYLLCLLTLLACACFAPANPPSLRARVVHCPPPVVVYQPPPRVIIQPPPVYEYREPVRVERFVERVEYCPPPAIESRAARVEYCPPPALEFRESYGAREFRDVREFRSYSVPQRFSTYSVPQRFAAPAYGYGVPQAFVGGYGVPQAIGFGGFASRREGPLEKLFGRIGERRDAQAIGREALRTGAVPLGVIRR